MKSFTYSSYVLLQIIYPVLFISMYFVLSVLITKLLSSQNCYTQFSSSYNCYGDCATNARSSANANKNNYNAASVNNSNVY